MSFDPHSTPSLLFSTLPSSTSSTLSGSCSSSFQPRTCADPHCLGGWRFSGIRTSHRLWAQDGWRQECWRQDGCRRHYHDRHWTRGCSLYRRSKSLLYWWGSDSRNWGKVLLAIQPSLSSTQDSMESLATPQVADLDDEQIRALLAYGVYRSEKQVRNDHKFISLKRRFDVKFISKSELLRHRQTCFMVLTSEKIGSKWIFRERERQPADILRCNVLTQAKSELMKQEHKVESLNNCINELQQQACVQRLDLKNASHGCVESRREQLRLQEELYLKQKAPSRNSNSKHSWDGEKWRELKNCELMKSLYRCWEKVMKQYRDSLSSKVQELQKSLYYLNDTGEFHEVEWNYGGKFSYVPSQPARISSPAIYAELRQTLATWNMESIWTAGKRFCKSTFNTGVITNTLSRDSFIHDIKCCRSAPQVISTGRCTIPMPIFARRPPTMSSVVPVDIPQSSIVGQHRQQIPELQFDKFPSPSSFFILEEKIPKPSG